MILWQVDFDLCFIIFCWFEKSYTNKLMYYWQTLFHIYWYSNYYRNEGEWTPNMPRQQQNVMYSPVLWVSISSNEMMVTQIVIRKLLNNIVSCLWDEKDGKKWLKITLSWPCIPALHSAFKNLLICCISKQYACLC